MIYKTSILSLVLMPFLLLSNDDAREQLKQQIKEKEAELWNIERKAKKAEKHYQELYYTGTELCKRIMLSLTEKERQKLIDDLGSYDEITYELILSGEILKPRFTGEEDINSEKYTQLKFLCIRAYMYFNYKLLPILDSYGNCAQELLMLQSQLDALSKEEKIA